MFDAGIRLRLYNVLDTVSCCGLATQMTTTEERSDTNDVQIGTRSCKSSINTERYRSWISSSINLVLVKANHEDMRSSSTERKRMR